MQLDVLAILPIIIAAVALVYNGMSFRRLASQDTSADAASQAKMSADIRYIRDSIDDIKLENRAIKKELDDVKGRLIVAEEQIKRLISAE